MPENKVLFAIGVESVRVLNDYEDEKSIMAKTRMAMRLNERILRHTPSYIPHSDLPFISWDPAKSSLK